MKITPVYENEVFVVPKVGVARKLATAAREELAVLLSVLAEPEFTPADRAAALNLTEKTFLDALAFWQREGVFTISDGEKIETTYKKVTNKLSDSDGKSDNRRFLVTENVRGGGKTETVETAESTVQNPDAEKQTGRKSMHARRELPHYGVTGAADYLERNADMRNLVDCCQNISGEMFSTAETEILIGMHDYLALSPEYIMLLFAHAKKLGKKSVRYVETLAIRFFDEGVTGYTELEERLRGIEKTATAEQFVRELFGLRSRALIPKEKAMVEKWVHTMHYDKNIVQKAYEITVNNTGKPSLSYANAILENWYKAGLATLEDIEASIAEYQKAHEKEPGKESSFDTEDFFGAALRRSYGDS